MIALTHIVGMVDAIMARMKMFVAQAPLIVVRTAVKKMEKHVLQIINVNIIAFAASALQALRQNVAVI